MQPCALWCLLWAQVSLQQELQPGPGVVLGQDFVIVSCKTHLTRSARSGQFADDALMELACLAPGTFRLPSVEVSQRGYAEAEFQSSWRPADEACALTI